MFILFIYLGSLLGAMYYINQNRDKIEAGLYEPSYKIEEVLVDTYDTLGLSVEDYCNSISTSECESWDVFENKILVGYTGDDNSLALLTILANLFRPSNIHVFNFNPYCLDFNFDDIKFGSLITYHQSDDFISMRQACYERTNNTTESRIRIEQSLRDCSLLVSPTHSYKEINDWNEYLRLNLLSHYKKICHENDINIIFESSTNNLTESTLTDKLNIHRPFSNVPIDSINLFIKKYYE